VRDGAIGALAFSATRFDDWLEIGIETRAAYRGQGLARAVAVAMIENCLAQGLTPVWACRKENTGSLHLAQSLGFVITTELPFYRLAAR
jgi:RimJ/RimL family protein N-acetyltransferase